MLAIGAVSVRAGSVRGCGGVLPQLGTVRTWAVAMFFVAEADKSRWLLVLN